jgi:hypothetical protein
MQSAKQPAPGQILLCFKPGVDLLDVGPLWRSVPMERNLKYGVSGLRGDVPFGPQGQFQAFH